MGWVVAREDSPLRPIRLLSLTLFAFLFVLGLANLWNDLGSLFTPLLYRRDFLAIYVEIRAVAAGYDPFLPVDALALRYVGIVTDLFPHPTPHPPTMAVIFAFPLARLSYQTAAIAWFALQLGCLVAAISFLHRVAGRRPKLLVVSLLTVAAAGWSPIDYDLLWANFSLILLALLLGMFLAAQRGHPGRAGALLGLSLLIKPIAWPIFLAFALQRQWRAVGATALVGGVGVAMTAMIVGIPRLLTYVSVALPTVGGLDAANYENTSLSAVAWHLFVGGTVPTTSGSATLVTRPLLSFEPAARIGAVALPLLVLGLSVLAIRRWLSLEWSILLTISLSAIITPISWEHENTLLLVPMTFLARRFLTSPPPSLLTAATRASVVLLLTATGNWMNLLAIVAASRASSTPAAPLAPVATLLLTIPTIVVVFFGIVLCIAGRNESQHPSSGSPQSRQAPNGRLALPFAS